MKPIPSEWRSALRKIQHHVPEAILAGGCLRDLALGGEVKDLDVFVPAFSTAPVCLDFVMAHEFGVRPCAVAGAAYVAGASPEFAWTRTYDFVAGPPINMVALDYPCGNPEFRAQTISRMDFGACQIGFDGVTISATPEAWDDLANRRFTLVRAETCEGVHRSLERASRFAAKYGDSVTFDLSRADPFYTDYYTTRLSDLSRSISA